GGPALAGIAAEQRWHVLLAWRRRRAVVDEALGGQRRRHPLADQPHDLEHPLALTGVGLDAVADVNGARRLHRSPVDGDVAALAGVAGDRSLLVDAHGPQPLVDAGAVRHPSRNERMSGIAVRSCTKNRWPPS